MVIIVVVYLALVYLLFFKFRWLPWNAASKIVTVFVGAILLMGFLVGFGTLAPVSSQGAITARIVEISPQVSGRVMSVEYERNVVVEAGTPLFSIIPTPYQARVDDLEARLALSRLRLEQYENLAKTGAGKKFDLQQAQSTTRQLEAQLVSARFDLDNTVVRAPSRGMVPRMFLKEGIQVSPSKSVLAFVDTTEILVGGLFEQKALQNVKIGDRATVNFHALPGRVFESKVVGIPGAIGDTQFTPSGQLGSVQGQRMVVVYPVYVALPEDFPENLKRPGLAAVIYIHTENAGMFGKIASAMQWIATSLNAVL